MSDEMKACQYCGEAILATAIKCKHCGSMLDGSAASSSAPAKQQADYGVVLLAIPVVACMLIWFWVSGMNLLQSPGDTMALIMLGTVLGTAAVAALEAGKLGMKSDRQKGSYGPTSWFFLIALLWIVGYPAYLYKRKDYGVANRLALGLLVAVMFIGSWAIMNAAIESKKDEVRGNLENLQKQLNSLGE